MLAKCANPACFAPFRYLHEGKLFRLDLGAGPPTLSRHVPRQVQYFWLCERCARTMTLEMRGGKVTARAVREPAAAALSTLAAA